MEEKVAKRAAYIENLNAQILSGKFVPNRDNGVQMRSLASQTKYYSIVGGSNEQTLFFYDVSPSGFYSFVFKLYNDASSEEDAEFDVYAVNSDGTIGTHLAGQVNEIHPGSSKSTYVLSSTYLGPDFAVIVENDGWWWDTDVQITGRVVCNE
ncbi:MAG: hypothetical protein LBD75_01315 [Candidatus Peribacteria bacterium]|nr:hypothetical protein [Candidatus Peribacteria bacterium]